MKKKSEIPRTVVTYRIQAKASEYILCPANAIEHDFYVRNQNILPQLGTTDGSVHEARFESTWNNANGAYDEELDRLCQRMFRVPFVSVRSMWIGRLGRIDDYWHLIKLEKI